VISRAPSTDDREASPRVGIFIDAEGASAAAIDESCRSIAAQRYPRLQARFLGAPDDPAAIERLAAWAREENFAVAADPGVGSEFDLVGRLRAGDCLDERAIACFIGAFARDPAHELIYCDETQLRNGVLCPVHKPGWSPTLLQSGNYIGRAAFFRASLLSTEPDWMATSPEALIDRLAQRATPASVGALSRPLFQLAEPAVAATRDVDAVYRGASPSVGIVIPTRDMADLLQDCLESLFEKTSYGNYKVVVVDNDSAEEKTHHLLERMRAAHERLTILPSPGDFNFCTLSNAGAEAVGCDYLLFLNNDTRILTPDWIERLLFFATQPGIGAVGAKLLYPNRSTQHVGVLLGMGGVAGHYGAGLDEHAPGWMRRNLVPHEVSAVTGACLMVERAKFEAVGRFDAENLPVDLNDVDLCLRLGAQGWRTICNSEVVLIHHQSASRGGGLRLQQVYERERRFFREKWRATIRDDPYFNPGLSLYAYEPMLP